MSVGVGSADALLDAWKTSGLAWEAFLAEERIVRDPADIPAGEPRWTPRVPPRPWTRGPEERP